MSAYVEHKFKKGFILNEENLRKMHELILKRFNEIDDTLKPEYEIQRKDSYCYLTNDVKDIVNEDNSVYNKIQNITILGKKDDEFYFELTFSQSDGTKLLIKGENRDLVFLLLSDLRTYMNNDVNKRFVIDRSSIRNIFFCIEMLILIVPLISLLNLAKKTSGIISYEIAIKSNDLQEKLNYLINQNHIKDDVTYMSYLPIYMIGVVIIGIIPIFFDKLIQKIILFLYPSNIFLFGKAIVEYEKANAIKNKILWAIVVSFIISLVAGFIVFYVTTK